MFERYPVITKAYDLMHRRFGCSIQCQIQSIWRSGEPAVAGHANDRYGRQGGYNRLWAGGRLYTIDVEA
jgi:hypothetical protein